MNKALPCLLLLIILGICRGSFLPETSFSIDTALRSLAKAVFTHAILPNDARVKDALSASSTEDTSECIKKLICVVQGIPPVDRTWDETAISAAVSPKLEFQSTHIQLQLAAKLGHTQPAHCSEVYSRCPFDKKQLMRLIRQRGMSLNIPTSPDSDCNVIFLWKRVDEYGDSNNNELRLN